MAQSTEHPSNVFPKLRGWYVVRMRSKDGSLLSIEKFYWNGGEWCRPGGAPIQLLPGDTWVGDVDAGLQPASPDEAYAF